MGFLAMNRSSAFSHRREIQSDKSGELNAENWLEGIGQGVASPGNRLPSDSTGRTSINFTGAARRGVAWRVAIERPGRAGNSTRSRCLRTSKTARTTFFFSPPISSNSFLFGNTRLPRRNPTGYQSYGVNQIPSRVVSIVARLAVQQVGDRFVDFRSSRKKRLDFLST